jgi:hypothetical protein
MFQDNLRRFSNMKRRLRLTFEVKSWPNRIWCHYWHWLWVLLHLCSWHYLHCIAPSALRGDTVFYKKCVHLPYAYVSPIWNYAFPMYFYSQITCHTYAMRSVQKQYSWRRWEEYYEAFRDTSAP